MEIAVLRWSISLRETSSMFLLSNSLSLGSFIDIVDPTHSFSNCLLNIVSSVYSILFHPISVIFEIARVVWFAFRTSHSPWPYPSQMSSISKILHFQRRYTENPQFTTEKWEDLPLDPFHSRDSSPSTIPRFPNFARNPLDFGSSLFPHSTFWFSPELFLYIPKTDVRSC